MNLRKAILAIATLALMSVATAHAQRGPGGAPEGRERPGGPGGPGGMRPPAMHNGPYLGPPGRFWNDSKISRALNLRPEQQHRMDDIFAAQKNTLHALLESVQREESRLRSMSKDDLQDEAKVLALIDKVSQARTELEKANARMLIQIRREMDAGQLARLEDFRPPPPG